MKTILMAAAVVLVSGAPLAFAATSGNMSTSDLTDRHCSYLNQQLPQERFESESARLEAEQHADAVCRQDRHKNGGAQPTAGGLTKK